MTKPASITVGAKITIVTIMPMAAATTTAISFSLWQIASHCFLPPTTAATTATATASAFPFTVFL